jgi:AAA family ATP:ADP antiporter
VAADDEVTRARAETGHPMRLFGDVRAGERRRVVLLGVHIFLLLTAYYLLKTVREPLILLWGIWGLKGEELKIYATAAQALLLLAVVPLYGLLTSRVRRLTLMRVTLIAFVGSLGLFIVLGANHVPIAAPFYMWLGIIGLLGVAQFWSLAADLYDREAGERLFGVIAIGGSAGSILGAQFARWLIGPIGIYGLMGVAAALYAGALLVVTLVERTSVLPAAATAPPPPDAPDAPAAPHTRGALSLVLHDPYLLLIGALLILANLVNTQGEYILANAVKAHAQLAPQAAREAIVGQFYGTFYTIVNGIALVVQALLVARVLKRGGARFGLFLLPAVALAGYGAIALLPSLTVVALAKVAENSFDYSMQSTVRQALFLPTDREIKYKGKAAVDTVCVRLGDMVAGALVLISLHGFGLTRRGFAVGNLILVVVWLVVAAAIARRHRRLAGDEPAWRPRWRLRLPALWFRPARRART